MEKGYTSKKNGGAARAAHELKYFSLNDPVNATARLNSQTRIRAELRVAG
ncbi:MAG: hypothetical protein ACHQYQ_10785 [Bacteriovoracales bacterium]